LESTALSGTAKKDLQAVYVSSSRTKERVLTALPANQISVFLNTAIQIIIICFKSDPDPILSFLY